MLFRPYYESHVLTFFIDKCIPYVSTNVGQLLFFDMGSLSCLSINNLLAKYWFFWTTINIPPT
jgi:hypothetical protein